ncbi:ParE family toxin-like protein [Klebsiella pneumoniae]|uniref:ParE family toxin-like protein n=1 Tax=Klebsiella pneumoniae TaxID=573 RepID=UPI000E2ED9DB
MTSTSLLINCQAPEAVRLRARDAVSRFLSGCRNYTRLKPRHYLVIRIGCRWRLLSKDEGQHWSLITHEKYNKEYWK